MSVLQPFMNKQVEVEVSGKNVIMGTLLDMGLDLIVLLNEQQYSYIPLVHVQNVKAITQPRVETTSTPPGEQPIDYQSGNLTYRKILTNAKGRFVEIYVTGNKTIHGYLTSIMNDYFVFYSPVYKAMFVSMNHLKWLIPYQSELTPYTLDNQSLPLKPVNIALSRSFEEQCKKLKGHLVVFDLGDNPDKIGLLQKVENQLIELVTASGKTVVWGIDHLKTVYLP